eukprot:UN34094
MSADSFILGIKNINISSYDSTQSTGSRGSKFNLWNFFALAITVSMFTVPFLSAVIIISVIVSVICLSFIFSSLPIFISFFIGKIL